MNVNAAKVAVVFGGPSPEHDVSILTGLQAAHELAGAQRDVIGLYWSKTGEWFRTDAALEAADFIDGVPRWGPVTAARHRGRRGRVRGRCRASGPHPTTAARRGRELLSRWPG